MSDFIPLSVPSIKGNEWKYVKECLDSEWVSSEGKYVDLFEKKISEYTGSKYAIACVNGTSALHISLIIAGVQPNDEVIVPTLTFIAPINAIRYCNAQHVFMDADKYYNIDAEKTIEFILNETELVNSESGIVNGKWVIENSQRNNIEAQSTVQDLPITVNKKTKRRIAAIILVHVFGNAVWLDELYGLCKKRNIKIIEDATESLGTRYTKGKFSGKHTGTIGELGCLSFNGNKIITTGGGGMILTDDKKLAEKARYLTTQAKDDSLRYVHNEVGYNYRLTNIQAALGVAQLERLSFFLKRKREIHEYYTEGVKGINGLSIASTPDYAENNRWLNVLLIDSRMYKKGVESVMLDFRNKDIETRPVWFLNHLQKPYIVAQKYKIENANLLISKSLCLPSSISISNFEIDQVINSLKV